MTGRGKRREPSGKPRQIRMTECRSGVTTEGYRGRRTRHGKEPEREIIKQPHVRYVRCSIGNDEHGGEPSQQQCGEADESKGE